MKVVMFGATGFIGSHIASEVNRHHDLLCIVRSGSITQYLDNEGIHYKAIEFNKTAVEAIVSEADVVINAVAVLSGSMSKREETELKLLSMIIEAIDERSMAYLHLGSIISYGYKLPDHAIDELFKPDVLVDEDRTSALKDKMVEEIMTKRRIKYVNIQPSSTIGRRDTKSMSHRILKNYNEGKFPIVSGGNHNLPLIDTRDIGRAFLFAVNNIAEIQSGSYIIKGYDTTWLELKMAFDKYFERRAKSLRLPLWLLLVIVRIAAVFGGSNGINKRIAYILGKGRFYSSERFESYGFKPVYDIDDNITYMLDGVYKESH